MEPVSGVQNKVCFIESGKNIDFLEAISTLVCAHWGESYILLSSSFTLVTIYYDKPTVAYIINKIL